MPMVYNESRNYPAPKDAAYEAALKVLDGLNVKIKDADKQAGTISGRKGASLWTWGEHIAIKIDAVPGGCAVYVESRVKYQLVDYGRNRENVVKVLAELDRSLPLRYARSAPGLVQAPTPNARFCTACGKPIAPDAKFCERCGQEQQPR